MQRVADIRRARANGYYRPNAVLRGKCCHDLKSGLRQARGELRLELGYDLSVKRAFPDMSVECLEGGHIGALVTTYVAENSREAEPVTARITRGWLASHLCCAIWSQLRRNWMSLSTEESWCKCASHQISFLAEPFMSVDYIAKSAGDLN